MYSPSRLKIEFKVYVMSADGECTDQIRDRMKTQFRACQQVKNKKSGAQTEETWEDLNLSSGALTSSADLLRETQ